MVLPQTKYIQKHHLNKLTFTMNTALSKPLWHSKRYIFVSDFKLINTLPQKFKINNINKEIVNINKTELSKKKMEAILIL